MIFDCHMHLVHSKILKFPEQMEYTALACALSKSEFLEQNKIIESICGSLEKKHSNIHFLTSFGIHPQNPDISEKDFLIELLEHNKIDAIGECGFDLFTEQFKLNIENQEKTWAFQLECAIKYEKPLVVHGRKCTHLFFRDIKSLKKVPAVIFHSWAGTFLEAASMLQKGVNAYFSFGKPLINGKKSAIECVKRLNRERILFETDSPYQTLKGEQETLPQDILKVYEEAEKLRGEKIEPDLFKVLFAGTMKKSSKL